MITRIQLNQRQTFIPCSSGWLYRERLTRLERSECVRIRRWLAQAKPYQCCNSVSLAYAIVCWSIIANEISGCYWDIEVTSPKPATPPSEEIHRTPALIINNWNSLFQILFWLLEKTTLLFGPFPLPFLQVVACGSEIAPLSFPVSLLRSCGLVVQALYLFSSNCGLID